MKNQILDFDNRQEWSIDLLKDHIETLIKDLEEKEASQGAKGKLYFIIEKIGQLSDYSNRKKAIELYIYLFAAFLHNNEKGGLSSKEVGGLKRLMSQVLKDVSKGADNSLYLSMQYCFHHLLSEMSVKKSQYLLSSWELYSINRNRREIPEGIEGKIHLGAGFSLLRHANASRAILEFQQAERVLSHDQGWFQARVGNIKSMRLASRHEEALRLIEEGLSLLDSNCGEFYKLISWEKLLIEYAIGGDLDPIVAAVQRGKEHHEASFLGEAFLLVRAIKYKKWLDRLPKVSTIMTKPGYSRERLGVFFKALHQFEFSDDASISFDTRFDLFRSSLNDVNDFYSIEHVLLYYLALARWLSRNHCRQHAALVLGEYEGLSLRLTEGKNRDVLFFAEDILAKNWYTSPALSS